MPVHRSLFRWCFLACALGCAAVVRGQSPSSRFEVGGQFSDIKLIDTNGNASFSPGFGGRFDWNITAANRPGHANRFLPTLLLALAAAGRPHIASVRRCPRPLCATKTLRHIWPAAAGTYLFEQSDHQLYCRYPHGHPASLPDYCELWRSQVFHARSGRRSGVLSLRTVDPSRGN